MTFKIDNWLRRERLQNKCIVRPAISKCNTRNMKEPYLQRLTLEHKKEGFLYAGPEACDCIPLLTKDTESTVSFKNDLKSHLLG